MRGGRVRGSATRSLQAGRVHEVSSNEAVLLLDCRVILFRASPWVVRVVVIVTPLGLYKSVQVRGKAIDGWSQGTVSYEMVCKLHSGNVCVCVFEVDDHKLLVMVGWKK